MRVLLDTNVWRYIVDLKIDYFKLLAALNSALALRLQLLLKLFECQMCRHEERLLNYKQENAGID